MRILGLITARGGSKGIPGKNIKILGSIPLINYTIASAKESKLLSKIVLSSDDEEIMKISGQQGVEVPFKRPGELAEDNTPSLKVIQHALDFFKAKNENFDAICLLQPTTPFRRNGLIDDAIRKFISGNYDSLISVREIPTDFNPHWAFEDHNGILRIATGEKTPIPRRQELPKAYHRDGTIYITATRQIMEENSLLGDNIGFINTMADDYVNIDTISDWERAVEILKTRN
ncbi:acylneuraminate cytidylyltransferase family protein [Gramella sp. MT6]|uniref:acylneuraminate cytidylyltransferase family protein n=1 Tax=Gramella sp. MT6 TaxID=2705471 RepID=UPI001C5E1746|nr:acylneuraminate cytidylyltransferase family protein [Gramella sp. MT6]QYA24011.1 acylneuraminate cytidylyltransferase family protein [Gramella sp. MT6]